MSENHPTLLYQSKKAIYTKILEFLAMGIDQSERCIFLTTKSDADEIFQNLKKIKDPNKVIKLFSYFIMPDPVKSTDLFVAKISKIKQTVLNDDFKGRVAFNVLGDMSRFPASVISIIEATEKNLHSISNDKMKFLCTYQIGEENDSSTKMLKIAMTTHDQIIFENDDGSFSNTSLN